MTRRCYRRVATALLTLRCAVADPVLPLVSVAALLVERSAVRVATLVVTCVVALLAERSMVWSAVVR